MYSMVNKGVFDFFKQLGYPVYRENEVPSGATMPYVTITFTTADMGEDNIISGRIWSKSTNFNEVNNITDSLESLIGYGNKFKLDSGSLLFYKGLPFVQPYHVDDLTIKCNYFNVIMKIY